MTTVTTEQQLKEIYGTPENLVLSIAARYGVDDPKLIVTPLQLEDFKAAGLPESMMVINQKLPT